MPVVVDLLNNLSWNHKGQLVSNTKWYSYETCYLVIEEYITVSEGAALSMLYMVEFHCNCIEIVHNKRKRASIRTENYHVTS